MLKIESYETIAADQMKTVIDGMRNPMNSWDKSDSEVLRGDPCALASDIAAYPEAIKLGDNDLKLMHTLNKAGKSHSKYRRMIPVWVTITAPLYWWKEFDTYKVGTVCNSCSTMHKIHAKEFTLDDFSHEHLINYESYSDPEPEIPMLYGTYDVICGGVQLLSLNINMLNYYRKKYIETKDKRYWWQMIQLLPSSYNQTRTIMLNYEVLSQMYQDRKDHKLDEWHTFCDWIESLTDHEIIIEENKEK